LSSDKVYLIDKIVSNQSETSGDDTTGLESAELTFPFISGSTGDSPLSENEISDGGKSSIVPIEQTADRGMDRG
jgi:hypothetical protein